MKLLDFKKLGVITIQEVAEFQDKLFKKCRTDMVAKGNDYSGNGEDTFENIRIAQKLGLVETASNSAFVRALDKVMRIKNLTNPRVTQQVKDESLEDTLCDLFNYFTYVVLLSKEQSALDKKKNDSIIDVS